MPKVCILILGGNQLWKNDPFQDKNESWTSANDYRWNLVEETTDDDEILGIQTLAYIKRDGNTYTLKSGVTIGPMPDKAGRLKT